MSAELDELGAGAGAEVLETLQGARFHDLANGGIHRLAKTGVDSQDGVTADQLVDALAQSAVNVSSAALCGNLIEVSLLHGEHLHQRGEALGIFSITQSSGFLNLWHDL